jgi:hypothetical protein
MVLSRSSAPPVRLRESGQVRQTRSGGTYVSIVLDWHVPEEEVE